MAITYTRTFTHHEWLDNVSRVQAGGEDGFNVRFHSLEGEFDAISGVVGQISRAIDLLSATPSAREVQATFTPTLVATGGAGWTHGVGFAQKPSGAVSASGMMTVTLPDRVLIKQFTASGQRSGVGDLRIGLARQSATDPSALASTIAHVAGSDNPFHQSALASDQFARVDNGQFKYYITAQLDNAAANDTVTITSFQVIYVTSRE